MNNPVFDKSSNKTPDANSNTPDALGQEPEIYAIGIVRGEAGFGFTIADGPYEQKVKQILDRTRCKNLQEGDFIQKINDISVINMNHAQVVEVLKQCPKETETCIVVQRGVCDELDNAVCLPEMENPVPSNVLRVPRTAGFNNASFPGPPQSPKPVQYPCNIEDNAKFVEMSVTLQRTERGFGFRIVGGSEEGSQVAVGYIVPGGAADRDGRLRTNDEIVFCDDVCVINASHHKVVQLMGAAGVRGHVSLGIRRSIAPAPEV